MKVCTKCGIQKNLNSFRNDRTKSDGKYSSCKECCSAFHKIYLKNNPGVNAARCKAHRDANLETVRKKDRERYANNPKPKNDSAKKWRVANPEKMKQYIVNWNTRNPFQKSVLKHNRRARIKAAGGSFTAADIAELYKLQKGICVTCRVKLNHKFHVDHIKPIKLGGTNDKTNLQLLCAKCNLSKHAKDPLRFMQEKGFLC